jgi:hypothetical protein
MMQLLDSNYKEQYIRGLSDPKVYIEKQEVSLGIILIRTYGLEPYWGCLRDFDRQDVKEAVEKFNVLCANNRIFSGLNIESLEKIRANSAKVDNYLLIALATDFLFAKNNYDSNVLIG